MKKMFQRLSKKKSKLDSLRPLPKEVEQQIDEWLAIELTYSSNAIEGNSLTRLETAELIKKGVSAILKGKPLSSKVKPKTSKLMSVGELSKHTDEAIHTLRFWTDKGLLKVTQRTPSGYQFYSPSMIDRVRKIRHLQKTKRLTLEEIKQQIKHAA